MKLTRADSLPSLETRDPNSVYFVKNQTPGSTEIEVFVTDVNKNSFSTPSQEAINSAILAAISSFASSYRPKWSQIENPPATMTPSSHTHLAADISNFEDVIKETQRTYTAQQALSGGVLTESSGVYNWNADVNGQAVVIPSMVAGALIANPTNIIKGASYILSILPFGSTPAWGTNFKWLSESVPKNLGNGVYVFTFVGGENGAMIPLGPGYQATA